MTDLVWVKASGTHETPNAYHTDPECYLLRAANSAVEKPRSVINADLEECKVCAGVATPHRHTTDPQALRKRLLAADPAEVGR